MGRVWFRGRVQHLRVFLLKRVIHFIMRLCRNGPP